MGDFADGRAFSATAQPCQGLTHVMNDDECNCSWSTGCGSPRFFVSAHVEPLADGMAGFGMRV